MANVKVETVKQKSKETTLKITELTYGEVYILVNGGKVLGWKAGDLVIAICDYVHNFRENNFVDKETSHVPLFRKLNPGEQFALTFTGK